MRCSRFRRRYSAWIDTRRAAPLARDLSGHARTCRRCTDFIRTIEVLEESCTRARAGQRTGAEGLEAAGALAERVVVEGMRQGPLASPRGFLAVLASLLGPGALALLLVRSFRPEWSVLADTALLAAALTILGIEKILHAPTVDLPQPVSQEAPARPA